MKSKYIHHSDSYYTRLTVYRGESIAHLGRVVVLAVPRHRADGHGVPGGAQEMVAALLPARLPPLVDGLVHLVWRQNVADRCR